MHVVDERAEPEEGGVDVGAVGLLTDEGLMKVSWMARAKPWSPWVTAFTSFVVICTEVGR